MWPTRVRASVRFFEVEEQRQFAHIPTQQVDPQFCLLSGLRPTVVEPVRASRETGFFCAAPVVFEIRIRPQVLSGSDDHEVGCQVHPLEIDLLRRTGVILIKTYIGPNNLPRHSCLLANLTFNSPQKLKNSPVSLSSSPLVL